MKPSHKEPVISFVPVNVSSRHDGWTAARQIAFIEALAETACVEHACRAVGMSDSAAYKLRRSTRGCLFREAWDAALDYALHRLEQAALSRALNGVARPVFHKGEQVGEWRDYDERLTIRSSRMTTTASTTASARSTASPRNSTIKSIPRTRARA